MADTLSTQKSLANLQKANLESKRLTKESLETALLVLLKSKSLEHISIAELAKKAGVSRNAFYRHYQSKEELLYKLLKRTVLKIVKGLQRFDPLTQRQEAWYFLFYQVKQQKHLLHLAQQAQFEHWLVTIITRGLARYQRKHKRPLPDYHNAFWANAVVSVITKWLRDGMTIPIEKMAQLDLPILP